MANGPLTDEDIINHMKNCPEAFEYVDGVNKGGLELEVSEWKITSHYFEIYDGFPLTEYDSKLLINTLGLRMCHFVNTKERY